MPSSSSDSTGNIFLTTENLAFSMPLILVCTTYVYFKYIPLQYALPVLGAIALVFQVRSMLTKQRNKKLETLDESAIRDLLGEEDLDEATTSKNAAADILKAKKRVQVRLAQERKAENRKAQSQKKKKGQLAEDNEEEENDYAGFAKGTRKKNK